MPKAIVLLNSKNVGLGTLAPALKLNNIEVDLVDATSENICVLDPYSPEIMIILGGPQSPYQTDKYPYLLDEIALIKKRIERDLPTLGIAMGAQLIACALDEIVMPGHQKNIKPDISWRQLNITDEGKKIGLDAFCQNNSPVLCWQDDYYKTPAHCKILATAEPYGVQAFLYQKNCLALQFHAEVTEEQLKSWIIPLSNQLIEAGINIDHFSNSIEQYAKALEINAAKFWEKWF